MRITYKYVNVPEYLLRISFVVCPELRWAWGSTGTREGHSSWGQCWAAATNSATYKRYWNVGPAPGSVLKWGCAWAVVVGLDFNKDQNMPKLRAPVGHVSSFIVVFQAKLAAFWCLAQAIPKCESPLQVGGFECMKPCHRPCLQPLANC